MPQQRMPSQIREDKHAVIGSLFTDGCTEVTITTAASKLHMERRMFVQVRTDENERPYVWDMSKEQAVAFAALINTGAADL